jgi:hypothetical protein
VREREKEKERKRKRERKLVGRGGIAREGDSRCNDVSALQRPRARVRSLSFLVLSLLSIPVWVKKV